MTKEVKVTTKNLMSILKIVNRTDILEDVVGIQSEMSAKGLSEEELVAKQEAAGFAMFDILFKAIEHAEEDLYELIADIDGKTPEEVEAQDAELTLDTLESLVNSKLVQRFLKKTAG